VTIPLRRPSADTSQIVQAALMGLREIYRPGFNYAKAGVMLLDLCADHIAQGELDFCEAESADRSRLMTVLDQVNQRYGRGTLLVASAGLEGAHRSWEMKQERRSPQYTTRWADMAVARA
jgi:DNA polymerase V